MSGGPTKTADDPWREFRLSEDTLMAGDRYKAMNREQLLSSVTFLHVAMLRIAYAAPEKEAAWFRRFAEEVINDV
jgi:hypothetical protein